VEASLITHLIVVKPPVSSCERVVLHAKKRGALIFGCDIVVAPVGKWFNVVHTADKRLWNIFSCKGTPFELDCKMVVRVRGVIDLWLRKLGLKVCLHELGKGTVF
jgi:hypothetical protein